MTFRSATLSLALAALTITTVTAVAAEPNRFHIVNHSGKNVGHAFYSISPSKKGGYNVKAHFEYSLVGTPEQTSMTSTNPDKADSMPTEAQYTFNYKVDDKGDFVSGYTLDAATQIITSFQPNKDRSSVTIASSQGGQSMGSRPMGTPLPDYLLGPNYDPSSIQMLLTTAVAHPHPSTKYAFLVPGRARSSRDTVSSAGDQFVYVSLGPVPGTAPTGTLDGKAITLKHFELRYHDGKADIYTDADGNLMQANIGPLNVNFVRDGFTLAPQ